MRHPGLTLPPPLTVWQGSAAYELAHPSKPYAAVYASKMRDMTVKVSKEQVLCPTVVHHAGHLTPQPPACSGMQTCH